MSRSPVLDLIDQRVVLYDGATGTWLQGHDIPLEDFGGEALEGCNEMLCLTRPELIAQMHREYFEAGADIVETNSFGSGVALLEYDLLDRCEELNEAAAQIARGVADELATADHPRFVAGSIGPGTKFPTLGQITFDELSDIIRRQAIGLLRGGVDLLLIETQFDLLGVKATMDGCRRAMAEVGREVPLQVQVTIELTGRMLPGTEIAAALAALSPMRPDILGLNCATGPVEMGEHIRYLGAHCPVPVSVLPNAGLPSVVDGAMKYDLTADDFVEHISRFVTEFGVRVVGGCCGTTPEFIAKLAAVLPTLTPKDRQVVPAEGLASIYSYQPLGAEEDGGASLIMIGERTNANGSKKFREAMLAGDHDTCVAMAKEQVAEGSHVLDLCVDYVGRDGSLDMDALARRFTTESSVPLVLDSTEAPVLEAGLKWLGGRAVLNSANLEDGEEIGNRFDLVCSMARRFGAAIICLLIDEEGQARDVEWKMRVAHRIHDLATQRYGLKSGDLIFDALTFPLSTGDDDLRGDAMATIEAIRRINEELPECHTTLGLSNVSFGLSPAARHVLNSVFLAECSKVGLDSAIVHASKILPLSRIPDEQRDVCLDLIFDRRGTSGLLADGDADYDPLKKLLEIFSGVEVQTVEKEDRSGWPVNDRLSARIIDGDREGLSTDLDEALNAGTPALDIINDVLLDGMRVVGERFGSGEMQLPFVLQSAETMKAAVSYLEPHMEKAADGSSSTKGTLVLGTVKGDVHDIGKNLVDIILTNNGYTVHNLGIKISIAEMIEKANEVSADAIGMSGLLVKSTLVMRDNLEELNTRGMSNIPVMLGGAALTRTYVERDLRRVYEGRLFYGKDAFEGLAVMDKLGQIRSGTVVDEDWGRVEGGRDLPEREVRVVDPASIPARSPEIEADNTLYDPPFLGTRILKGLPIDEIAQYLNETAIFRNQWGFRPEKNAAGEVENDEEFKARIRPQLRALLADVKAQDLLVPQVIYGFFPANGDGDDLIIWTDDTRTVEAARFHLPRQTKEPWMCISDFYRAVNPDDSGASERDYAAFQIVSMGSKVSERTAELFAENKYQDYLMLHGLGVEMAEALAEYMHRRIRDEWGIASEDPVWQPGGINPGLVAMFRQKFRGGRYSWGYPACPDLEDNATIAALLDAERIGVVVNENTGWQHHPEQTTSAMICHHPKAKYFVAR
jgi:5-methyltetrahydrofolate--homocysteine methyltransferase